MNELRAPDRSLITVGTGVMIDFLTDGIPVAHRAVHAPRGVWINVDSAAYIAVPCRECFPAAPPPGAQPGCPYCEDGPDPDYHTSCLTWYLDPNLSWQLNKKEDE